MRHPQPMGFLLSVKPWGDALQSMPTVMIEDKIVPGLPPVLIIYMVSKRTFFFFPMEQTIHTNSISGVLDIMNNCACRSKIISLSFFFI